MRKNVSTRLEVDEIKKLNDVAEAEHIDGPDCFENSSWISSSNTISSGWGNITGKA
jgi:hypothetical protein